MKKARLTTGLVLLILLASLIPWPQATAITPQDQTISITDTHDDLFITETGIGIDSQLCHITDPNMDIRSFLVFRELEINYWEPLENATLRFRTTAIQAFDADSSVTVYGMRYSDIQREGWLNPSWVLTVPLTSASVNVNTSQFYGQTWHEVNVTTIVEELIRSYDWDGDGHAGTETGDAIGFIILGAEGYDTRWFIDYLYGSPSLAPQLVIHWNHEPPPPVGYEDAEFNETYGNYTIWFVSGAGGYSLEPMEYVFQHYPELWNISYDTFHVAPGTPIIIDHTEENPPKSYNNQRKLVRQSNGTLHTVWHKKLAGMYQIYTAKSHDNGTTWVEETRISTLAGMSTEYQTNACILVDSGDNLYVSWEGQATDFASFDQIWCNVYNFSISDWNGPLRVSTEAGMNDSRQLGSSMALDSNDVVHITWVYSTNARLYYNNYTTSWGAPLWISNYTGFHMIGMAGIAIDSEDNLHVLLGAEKSGVYEHRQLWAINRTTEWSDEVRLSTGPSMNVQPQSPASIAVDSEDNVHVTWFGESSGPTEYKVWYVNHTTSWTSPLIISGETEMYEYDQLNPTIALDSDDAIYILWSGRLLDETFDTISSSKYEGAGWNIEYLYPEIAGQSNKNPNVRWSRWPVVGGEDEFIVVDANGTVIQDGLDSSDDAEDWIDTYDPDPEDPDPGGVWSEGPGGETGAFTRFRMRLWFMLIGFGCLFGPILFFAWRRPSGYYLGAGFILMLIGLGMLLSIGQV